MFRVTCTVVSLVGEKKSIDSLVSRGRRFQLLARLSRVAGGGWGAYEDQDNGHHGGLCGLGDCSSEKSQVWAPRYYTQESRYRNNTFAIRDVEVKIQSAVPVRLRHHLLTRPRTVRECPLAPVQVR